MGKMDGVPQRFLQDHSGGNDCTADVSDRVWNGNPDGVPRRTISEFPDSLTTMTGSFNAIAQNLNVQRLYEKAFDQVMISPTPLWQFIVGQVIAGSLRGLYAGCVIMLLVLPIHTGVIFNGFSFLIMFLNGAVFSTIAVVVSFIAKNHTDVPRFSNYVIMPMSYLCNTFFAMDNMPEGIRQVIGALPLSQTSAMIRSIAKGEAINPIGILILAIYLAVFLTLSFGFIYKRKNL